MHLNNIDVSNVRGFLDGAAATAIDLPSAGAGWHVFAGRNGSGKSTLLRAIALAIVGPEHARHLVPSFAGWVRKGAREGSVGVKILRGKDDACQGLGKLPKEAVSARLSWVPSSAGCVSTRAPSSRRSPPG